MVNPRSASSRKKRTSIAQSVRTSPRRVVNAMRNAARRNTRNDQSNTPSRNPPKRQRVKPRRYRSSPDESDEELSTTSPPAIARNNSRNSMPSLNSRHSSSASSVSSVSSEDLLANDDDDDDEEEEKLEEEEVPGTQVLGNNVLVADAPMPESQWGRNDSSDDDDENLETPRRTPRSPSPSSASSGGDSFQYVVGDYPFEVRLRHFVAMLLSKLVKTVSKFTRKEVETAILIAAAAAVRELGPCDAATKYAHMLREYKRILQSIPLEYFANPELKNDMSLRLYNAQQNFTGERLWDQANKRLKILRNEMLPKFPDSFKDLPSGKGFHQMIRRVIRQLYMQANNIPEDTPSDEVDVPRAFVFSSKNCQTLLAALVHRKSPDIHETPAVLPPGPNRRSIRAAAHARKEQEKADSFAAAKQQEVEFKQAKIAKERATLALGVMSERQKAITLKLETLERYKDAYIEAAGGTRDSYLQAVSSLIKDMMAVSTDIPVDVSQGDSTTEEA